MEQNLCVSYENVKPKLKAFDLIFFKGKGFTGDLIRFGQWITSVNKDYNIGTLEFSHVGLILTSDLLQGVKNVLPNELYIWESTLNDRSGIGVADINGNYFKGVQLRNLDAVVSNYNKNQVNKAVRKGKLLKDSCISIAQLNEKSRECIDKKYDDLKITFPRIFKKYQGVHYDSQPLDLLGAMLKCFRWGDITEELNEVLGSKDWLFCSELVTVVFKEVGIFPETCMPPFVVPTDLLGHDSDKIEDGGIPLVVNDPINLKISDI